ncbi:TraR/DksA C4-type zinc finger protein [Blastococcus sp. TML/M2B]|uniref:TraR/DksA family transcriptional regulator n=1 Tax=unclassified Blastococcus TaxID=2619396 RepID=UPI00190C838A|nr:MULTISPECIES: TraR/DksA C4-type zinc finger protein [unclassified Blastococcus]MBN1092085.1 TraR/DksA C4-type zinc finger protein [Blastococcus sp. TML/M2B]MBN1097809.1 TraR/DksA C4-type zinc finger protein [Blastococcus sp. TML/C7B]
MTSTLDTRDLSADDARWGAFRTLLEDQRGDCVRQREAALEECAQSVPDPVALRRSASLQETITAIDEALARITDGTYGSCVHCGAGIPEERLELRPYAGACVACTDRR